MNKFIILFAISISFATEKLIPVETLLIDCHEPSDITFDVSDNSFYCVSDEGKIYQYSMSGKTLRSFKLDLRDMESVYVNENNLYVIDERTRQILTIEKKSLSEKNRKIIPYLGGANKAFEGITFNPKTQEWLIITEKSPVLIYELDFDFNIQNIIHEPHDLAEVSGVTYYNDHLWFIGDEDRTLSKVNPDTYKVIKKWTIEIPTPEGIVFANDTLFLVSDNFNMMYKMEPIK